MKVDYKNIQKLSLIVLLIIAGFFFATVYYLNSKIDVLEQKDMAKTLKKAYLEEDKEHTKDRVLFVNSYLKLSYIQNNKNEFLNIIKEYNKNNLSKYIVIAKIIRNQNNAPSKLKFIIHPFYENKSYEVKNLKILSKKFLQHLITNQESFKEFDFVYDKFLKEKRQKVSYFLYNKAHDIIITSGFYKKDIRADLKEINMNFKEISSFYLNKYMGLLLLFFAFFIALVIYIFKYTNNIFSKYEKELNASKFFVTQYSNIMETNNVVLRMNKDFKLLYASEQFLSLSQLKKEELLLKPIEEIQNFDLDLNTLKQNLQDEKIVTCNSTIKSSEKTMYFESTISPLRNKDNKVIEYIIVQFDLSDEKSLQDELINKNNYLTKTKLFLDESQKIAKISNWEYNPINESINFSESFFEMLQINKEDFSNHISEVFERIYIDDLEKSRRVFYESVENKKPFFLIHRIHKTNGELIVLEVRGIWNDNRLIGTTHDITEISKNEEALKTQQLMLQQQSKMASMGEMISNIAHQWKQPLNTINVIVTGTQLEKEFSKIDEDVLDKNLNTISELILHMSHTIDDFSNFFKPQKMKVDTRVTQVIKKARQLQEASFENKNIAIIENIEDAHIKIFENELIQVLLNLMQNAKDALLMNDIDDKKIFITTYFKNDYLVIKIKDTANGIPEDILHKIFDPYFTTKPSDKGTGIGLFMSKEIIEKHMNGILCIKNKVFTYQNKEYKGACFYISIPMREQIN